MTTEYYCDDITEGLNRTLELLNDLHEALEENAYAEEAEVVSKHLEQLKSPQLESRILIDGITPVLEELSHGFCDEDDDVNRPFD